MIDVAREAGVDVVVMHMLGDSQDNADRDSLQSFPCDIYEFFEERVRALEGAGIAPEKIVLDPGSGSARPSIRISSVQQARFLQTTGENASCWDHPERRFLGKILNEPVAAARDMGTLGTVAIAAWKGASIVGHDVPSAVHVCKVVDAVKRERIDP